MYPELQRTLGAIITDRTDLPADREARLRSIAKWIGMQLRSDRPAHLVFICMHNSRRSQLAQVWAAAAAGFHGLPVKCWSAGTEVTEVAPPVIDALAYTGFRIDGAGGFVALHGLPIQYVFIVNWDDAIDHSMLPVQSIDVTAYPS